jgi:hypothetical protein
MGMPLFSKTPQPKINYKPLKKLRKIHWENINPKVYEQSVWKELFSKTNDMEEELYKNGLFKDLDEQFQFKEISQRIEKSSSDATIGEIKVLSEKRAQNILIFIGTLKIPVEQLVYQIRCLDESKLSETILSQCLSSMPTNDEVFNF